MGSAAKIRVAVPRGDLDGVAGRDEQSAGGVGVGHHRGLAAGQGRAAVQAAVDLLGRLGDGMVNAAGGLVPGHGQGAAVPLLPCGLQRMSEQRQPPGAVVGGNSLAFPRRNRAIGT
jgi:hypothetical protein